MTESPEDGVRINRYLASCGMGSRRGCEAFVREGRVTLNGDVVRDLSMRVREGDHVKLDGSLVRAASLLTIAFNKPRGCLCTRDDPEGRKTIYDLLPRRFHKLNYVGRLDSQSSGLLLLTNSGEFTELLTHPRHHVEKEYHVVLDRAFDTSLIPEFLAGIPITEGLAKAEAVHADSRKRLRVVLTQGYNRQIRRMFSRFEYKVRALERFRIGSLVLPELDPGDFHVLNHRELRDASRNPGEVEV